MDRGYRDGLLFWHREKSLPCARHGLKRALPAYRPKEDRFLSSIFARLEKHLKPAGVLSGVELVLYLLKKLLDPLRLIDRLVVEEFDSRNEAEFELLADFGTDESQGAL